MSNVTRILAVDDREENLVALAAVLDALPVEVVPVSSGRDALRELLNDDFALILLDVVMPDMDGFETAEHIKSRPRTRDVPIIFLTAAGEDGQEALRGYAAGAVDYLTKPFDPWLLRAKVAVFVELHRRTEQLRRQAELLRRTLGEEHAGGAGGTGGEERRAGYDRLLKALDERVARVEHDITLLRDGNANANGEGPAHGEGPAVAGGDRLGDLESHVVDLRLALNALSTGT